MNHGDLLKQAEDAIAQALSECYDSEHELNMIKSKVFGPSGLLAEALQVVRELPRERRADYGKLVNTLKQRSEEKFAKLKERFDSKKLQELLSQQQAVGVPINTTAGDAKIGTLNPIQSAIADVCRLLDSLGFTRIHGPEVETVQNNFDNLNIVADHPARSPRDTFYLANSLLLRTHTTASLESSGMSGLAAPFRAYIVGPAYRNDDEDASHTQMFHQLEIVVMSAPGEILSFTNLKALIGDMVCAICEVDKTRARLDFVPSYFPFTEPSVEVYVNSQEIMGAGLLHQDVLRRAGFNNHTCLALGMGIERIVAIKNKVHDIRHFYELDARNY